MKRPKYKFFAQRGAVNTVPPRRRLGVDQHSVAPNVVVLPGALLADRVGIDETIVVG